MAPAAGTGDAVGLPGSGKIGKVESGSNFRFQRCRVDPPGMSKIKKTGYFNPIKLLIKHLRNLGGG
jgi:hypothetical protein